jgi:hypothetical protein
VDTTSILAIISAAAISTLASISFRQLRSLRKQMSFSTFLKLMDDLDDEQARKDREIIYRLSSKGDDFLRNMEALPIEEDAVIRIATEVTERNTRYALERTIKNLDKIGYVLLKGPSKKEEAPVWIWERALAMWHRLEPFIRYIRNRPGRQNYGIYFEELAKYAQNTMKSNPQ